MRIKQEVRSVYVIYNRKFKMTKIGFSNNPKRRLETLQTACGCELQLYYCSKQIYNYAEVESNMHSLYSDKRGLGEWFYMEPKQAAVRLKQMVIDKEECRIIEKYENKIPVTVIAYQMKVSRQGIINYLKSKGYLKPRAVNNIPTKKERSKFIYSLKPKLSLQEMVDVNNKKIELKRFSLKNHGK